METTINQITLVGVMETAPALSHENHGRRFFAFTLAVERLSGAVDRIRILAAEDLLARADVAWGEVIRVVGQIRSYNQHTPTGRHLLISVYAQSLELSLEPQDNRAEVTGNLCRPPVFRATPLGREILDLMLAVNRPYHRTDYLPCIVWGRTARALADLPVGTPVQLVGRLQSRDYTKHLPDGTQLRRTAYELSAAEARVLAPVPG